MKEELNNFSYTILQRDNVMDSCFEKLYEDVYNFWKDTWKGIFTKVGSPEAWIADDFLRQDYIPVITYKGEIVASHYYTIFDLKNPSLHDVRYFSIFPEESKKWIFNQNFRRAMSMEFLSVHKNWRKKALGFSAAEVLIALGFNHMKEIKADVALGVAVKATGVDEMAKRLSCSVLATGIKRGNLVCDLISQPVTEIEKHPDENIQNVINHLWENRLYSEIDRDQLKVA